MRPTGHRVEIMESQTIRSQSQVQVSGFRRQLLRVDHEEIQQHFVEMVAEHDRVAAAINPAAKSDQSHRLNCPTLFGCESSDR